MSELAKTPDNTAKPPSTVESPGLWHSIVDSRETWRHVLSGNASNTEKAVAGIEAIVGTGAVIVAGKLGLRGEAVKAEKEIAGVADTAASLPLKSGLNRVFVESNGERRPFDVFVPERTNPEKPTPLIMALHGVAGAGDARGLMEAETGLNSLAQEMAHKDGVGAIVAYPVSKEKTLPFTFGKGKLNDWNSPGAALTGTRSGYDDVDYLKKVVDSLKTNPSLNIDSQAQHIMGFSSGAEFAIHTHNRLPGTFAGVGSIHGTLLGTEAKAVEGNRAAFVAVLGENDHMLPMKGGRGLMTSIGYPKIADSRPLSQAVEMAKANGHTDAPVVVDSKLFEHTQYPEQPGKPAVDQFIVKNGQHAIDGIRGKGGWPLVGNRNPDFEATDVVVNTLLKHRLPDGTLAVSRTFEK